MKKYLIIAAVAAGVIYAFNNFPFVYNVLKSKNAPKI